MLHAGIDNSYNRITYLNTSSFALYLLPFWLRKVLATRREVKDNSEDVTVRGRRYVLTLRLIKDARY